VSIPSGHRAAKRLFGKDLSAISRFVFFIVVVRIQNLTRHAPHGDRAVLGDGGDDVASRM
jgi:hypothetical protein